VTPLVWFSEPALRGAGERIASGAVGGVRGTIINSERELGDGKGTVVFVDKGTLPKVESFRGLVIAVSTEPVPSTIPWLREHSKLCHVVSASLLEQPIATSHLANVLTAASTTSPRLLDWIDGALEGRRVRLANASRRTERLDKMVEFFTAKNIGSRTIHVLRDAAEELLTNAFYNAPVAAGVFDEPVSRELDVLLPDKYACDLAYGAREDFAVVRVKDPFGSFARTRLVDVLTRCSKANMQVTVDESMGGAGLGMWRIFTGATLVGVSVSEGKHTEILVGVSTKRPNPRPYGYHFFFNQGERPRLWKLSRDESVRPGLNNSVLLQLTE
jgi:hypothetical protein